MSEWEVHWLGDVEYFVRCRPRVSHTTCIALEFEAFQGVGWGCSEGPPDWPLDVAYSVMQRNDQKSGDETTVENLDEAHRAVYGRVNWDSAGHLYFGEGDGYLYCGDRRDAEKLGRLLGHLWRMAWEFALYQSPGSEAKDFEWPGE